MTAYGDWWLGDDPLTIIISTLVFLPVALNGTILLSSIPTFYMHRKKVGLSFAVISTITFLLYFSCTMSFLVGMINAQLESKSLAVVWNSVAVFCFGFGKIAMYSFFIERLRTTKLEMYQIRPLSNILLIIAVLLLLTAFLSIFPVLIDIVADADYSLPLIIAFVIQLVMDLFMLQQFGSRLFRVKRLIFVLFCFIYLFNYTLRVQ